VKAVKKLTPEQFQKTVEQGRIEPLYLFTGFIPEGGGRTYTDDDRWALEEYLLSEALKTLIEKALPVHSRDFNLSRFSALTSNLADILAVAQEVPIFSSRRIVIVWDLDKKLKSQPKEEVEGKASAAAGAIASDRDMEQKTLIEYLKHPNSTTTLVLILERLDRRLNIVTALLKACTVVEFRRFSESEAIEWVKNHLRREGCFMEEAALGLLIGLVGTDLSLLSNEVEKLVTYVGGKGQIGRSDVESLVIHLREHSNFELQDLILARQWRRAARLLKHQLDAGEEPVKILGLIASLYRRMLMAKELMAQGAPNAEVAKAAGMSPYAVGKFNEHVRRIPVEEIIWGIKRIAQVDNAIKGSLGDPEEQLEVLVYELCTPGAEAAL